MIDYSELSAELQVDDVRDSEMKTLNAISKFLESHPEIGTQALQISSGEESIVIKTLEGFILNNLLPKQTKIVFSDSGQFSKSKDTIWIPRNIEALGMFGKIALAHEFGHILFPDDDRLTVEERMAVIAGKEAETTSDKVKAMVEEHNISLLAETEAWSYGKSVSELLGIDEIIFEDIMEYSLDHYFLHSLENIAISLEGKINDDDEKTYQLYEPRSQDYLTMTYKELIKYIEDKYESNRVIEIDSKVNKIIKSTIHDK